MSASRSTGGKAAVRPAGRRWERRSEARPREIVAAAVQLFTERGYAATRMEDVAARAGVTKATVYLYFADKPRLFEAVVREAMSPKIDRVEAMIAEFDGSTLTLLRMLLTFFEGLLDTSYGGIVRMIVAESTTFPELSELYADLVLRRGVALMTGIIERGVARGELRDVDARAVVPLVMGPVVLLGIFRHAFRGLDVFAPASAVLSEHAELLLRGLARDGHAVPPAKRATRKRTTKKRAMRAGSPPRGR